MGEEKIAEDPPQVGRRIGSYRLVRVLGQGGMATVFEAVNENIGKRVAVKVLLPLYSRDAEIERRFLNEARSVNRVQHPGLVNVFEFGKTEDGCTYIVMEYLEGTPLHECFRRTGWLSQVKALCLGQQLASALAAAHGKGIVHRDIKPSNIIVLPDPAALGGERTKILDFGIAKMTAWLAGTELEQPRTKTGVLMGTPAYMAPEQCRELGLANDRADVYSLAVILYQMLTGRLPFTGSPIPVMMKQISDQPPPIREQNPAIPEEVALLVHSMLEKEPDDRPAMSQVETRLLRLIALLTESGAASRINLLGVPPAGPVPLPPGTLASQDLTPSIVIEEGKSLSRQRRRVWVPVLLGALALGVLTGALIRWRSRGPATAEVKVVAGGPAIGQQAPRPVPGPLAPSAAPAVGHALQAPVPPPVVRKAIPAAPPRRLVPAVRKRSPAETPAAPEMSNQEIELFK